MDAKEHQRSAFQKETGEKLQQTSESQEQRRESLGDKVRRFIGRIGQRLSRFGQQRQSAEATMKSVNPDSGLTSAESDNLSNVESAAETAARSAVESLQALQQEQLSQTNMISEGSSSSMSGEQLADQYRRQRFDEKLKQRRPELLRRLPTESIKNSTGRVIGMRAPDRVRQAASSIKIEQAGEDSNLGDKEQRQKNPLSFSEAKSAIEKYANNLAESSDEVDVADANTIRSIASGLDAEGQAGVDAIDRALEYINGVLQTKSNLEGHMTPEMATEWQEQKAVKEALLAERKSRVTQLDSNAGKPTTEVQVDESVPHKSQATTEAEPKAKVISLDQRKAATQDGARPPGEIPDDRRGLFRFFKDNFGNMENVSLDEFRRLFSKEAESKFQGWLQKQLESIIKDKPPGLRYPDTVASVFGNNPGMLQRVIALKENRVIDQGELLAMPFSKVAEEYLNIALPKDYFDHFSRRYEAEAKYAA